MITYERIMSYEDLRDLGDEFFSKDWRKVTISPDVLSWNELNMVKLDEDTVRVFAVLNESRVYAGVILQTNGFHVVY